MRDNMIAVPFAPAARAGRIRDRSWSPGFAPPCRARPMATACARSPPQRRLRRSLRPGGVLRLGCPPLACRPRGCNRLPSCLLALRECNGHQVPGHHCWPTSTGGGFHLCAALTPQFPFEGEALIALAALPSPPSPAESSPHCPARDDRHRQCRAGRAGCWPWPVAWDAQCHARAGWARVLARINRDHGPHAD